MPSDWINESIIYITSHPEFGYLFSFVIAFLESMPIIGTVVPGSLTMTAVGTLIGRGSLPMVPTFICAITGAFLGDFVGFLVGRLGEHRIFKIWPFKNHKNWLESGRDFFVKHGTKSVIIGRFIGPVRSAVPMIASLMGMSYRRFILAGMCSATLWSLLYILPGYVLGKYSYQIPYKDLAKWIALAVVILIILGTLYALYKLIIWSYKKYYQKRLTYHFNTLITHRPWLVFFCNQEDASNLKPLFLFIWIVFLTAILPLCLLFTPDSFEHLIQAYPISFHSIASNDFMSALLVFSSFNQWSIAWIVAIFTTASTMIGIQKSIQSVLIYCLILGIAYLFLSNQDGQLFSLIFENAVLWLPLALSTFSKPTKHTSYSTGLYILYGMLTLLSNAVTVLAFQISLNLWILSWVIAAILISIYGVLSFRIVTPFKDRYLDSIGIHVPCIIILIIIVLFA